MPRPRKTMARAKTLIPRETDLSPIDHRTLEEENSRKKTKATGGLQHALGDNRPGFLPPEKSVPTDASSPSHGSSMENHMHPAPVISKRKRSSAMVVKPKKKSPLPRRQPDIVSVAVPVKNFNSDIVVLKTTVPLKPSAGSAQSVQFISDSDDDDVEVVEEIHVPKPRRSGRALTNVPAVPKRQAAELARRRTAIVAEKSGFGDKSPAKRATASKRRSRAKTMAAVPNIPGSSVEVIDNPTAVAGIVQKPPKSTTAAKGPTSVVAATSILEKKSNDVPIISISRSAVTGAIQGPLQPPGTLKRGSRPVAVIQTPRALPDRSVHPPANPLSNVVRTNQNAPKPSTAAKHRTRATTQVNVQSGLDDSLDLSSPVPLFKNQSKMSKIRSRATTMFPAASAALSAPKVNVQEIMDIELPLIPPKLMDTRPVKAIPKRMTIQTKNIGSAVPAVSANNGNVPGSAKIPEIIVPKIRKQVALKTAKTQNVDVEMPVPVQPQLPTAMANRKRTLRATTLAVTQATRSFVEQRKSQAAQRKTKQKRITVVDQQEKSVINVDKTVKKKKVGRVGCSKSGTIRSQRIKERDDDTDDVIDRSATSIGARVLMRQRNTKLYANIRTNNVSLPPKTKKATAQTKPTVKKAKKQPKRLVTKAKPVTDNGKKPKARVCEEQLVHSGSVESERQHPVRLSAERIKRSKSGFLKCSVNHVIRSYRILGKLGTGTFGHVMEVRDILKPRSQPLAMKIVQLGHEEAAKLEANMLENVGRLTGPGKNLFVQLFDQFTYHQHYCMLFETLGRSVYSVLEDNKFHPFPLEQVRDISYQMCLAVRFLRNHNIIHTDLKPENLLFVDPLNMCDYVESFSPDEKRIVVMRDCRIKVIDFGGAIFSSENHGSTVTTRHYRPPEVVLRRGWSYPLDMWSVGCIMYELYMGKALFSTEQDAEHLAIMEKCLGKLPRSMTKDSALYSSRGTLKWHTQRKKTPGHDYVRQCCFSVDCQIREEDRFNESVQQLFALFKKMLEYAPELRIKARQAVKDVYFRDVDPAIRSVCEE